MTRNQDLHAHEARPCLQSCDRYVVDHLPEHRDRPHITLPAGLVYPAGLNCVTELLDRHVLAGQGARTALIAPDAAQTHYSYQQLQTLVNRIANVLCKELGLQPGQRVLLRGYNQPWLVACWLAVLKAGGIVVTSMSQLRAHELGQMSNKAQIRFALCDWRLALEMQRALAMSPVLERVLYFNMDSLDGGPDRCTPDFHWDARLSLDAWVQQASDEFMAVATHAEEPALIAFTSGTTGQPKACVHTHRDLLVVADLYPVSILDTRPEDVYCASSPMAFTYGLGALLLFPFRHGATSLLLERPAAENLLEAVKRYRVSVLFSVPTLWRPMATLYLQSVGQVGLADLRCCVSAGEPLAQATRNAWQEASGLELLDGLGSTELLHIAIAHSPGASRPGAIGPAVPGYRLRILDETGQPLAAGQRGRLAIQGPTGCRYLDDSRQSDYVQSGWNLTGDTGHLDADGYFHLYARSDDIIVSAGYNIAGREVEDVLLQHPVVKECAVVGWPDSERGQVVKAFVVLHMGCQASLALVAELQDFVKQCIAPYKYPRHVEFLSSLPRTETSKLQRFRLRQGAQNS